MIHWRKKTFCNCQISSHCDSRCVVIWLSIWARNPHFHLQEKPKLCDEGDSELYTLLLGIFFDYFLSFILKFSFSFISFCLIKCLSFVSFLPSSLSLFNSFTFFFLLKSPSLLLSYKFFLLYFLFFLSFSLFSCLLN